MDYSGRGNEYITMKELEQEINNFLDEIIADEENGEMNAAYYRKTYHKQLKEIALRFARTIVEQSVPEKVLRIEDCGCEFTSICENCSSNTWIKFGFNKCRRETLSNADNLLK